MKIRQFSIAIATLIAATLALYLAIASQVLRDRPSVVPERLPQPTQSTPSSPRKLIAEDSDRGPTPGRVAAETMHSSGRKLLEIRGRVVDQDMRPIADARIAEERYFHQAQSDAEGFYRLLLDIPRHRYPTLHFLRSGYAGQRIKLGKQLLQDKNIHVLDVVLEDALDTVTQTGWIGNEFGLGLEGARVQLSASYSRNRDSYYLTEFSDANGNFDFEGIDAGQIYKLSANLTPEYPYYEDREFQVTPNPSRINIVLKKLSFVDIDGMILNRDSVPVSNYEMYIKNVTTGMHTRKIVSDSSGYFRLENFPLGKVELTTRGREFFKIDGIVIGDGAYQNLQIVVDRGNHHLSGWVVDESGVAVQKAMVTLDRKFTSGAITHTSYRSQATDRLGKFAFEGLGGGIYHLTVYALGYQKQDIVHRFEDPSGEIFVTLERNPP